MTAIRKEIPDIDQLWRAFPHTYAEKCSKHSAEKWIAYEYLKIVSRKIVEMISNGGGKLIVEMPPRHGKSTLISHWVPVWFLDLLPNKKVILATYQADFSSKWGRGVRDEILYNPLVEVELKKDSKSASRWDTTRGGGMTTAGIGGALTGKGGHLIIIDDPVKNWQEAASEVIQRRNIDWMKSTMRTRAEPGCVIIILQTRWHENDLAGALQDEEDSEYEVIRIPALSEGEGDPLGRPEGDPLCPDRYNREELLKIKKAIGTKFFSALFQQNPSPEDGEILKRHWWQFYDELPENTTNWIQSWDLTFKDKKESDFVASFTMCRSGANIYLVDRVKDKLDFSKSAKAVKQFKSKWSRVDKIFIEDAANGPAVISYLKDKIQGIIPVTPLGSKTERAYACQPFVEAGNVFLPNPKQCSWVSDFIEECTKFPNGKNDDQVDAFTQGCLKLRVKTSTNFIPIGMGKQSVWN